MKKKSQVLSIIMNGITVGKLEKALHGGLIFFYDGNWIDAPGARPISLSLPLVDRPFTGDLVYNFFGNLLPDNQLIRARIQSRFNIPTHHPFDLLAAIGKDCVGAIQFVNEKSPLFEKK